jgi:hypothetical protein
MKMVNDPGVGYRVVMKITGVKGTCSAGLSGFFYHDIFPSLSTFQFGGSLPWWGGDAINL